MSIPAELTDERAAESRAVANELTNDRLINKQSDTQQQV